jgi:hypothetical protein
MYKILVGMDLNSVVKKMSKTQQGCFILADVLPNYVQRTY